MCGGNISKSDIEELKQQLRDEYEKTLDEHGIEQIKLLSKVFFEQNLDRLVIQRINPLGVKMGDDLKKLLNYDSIMLEDLKQLIQLYMEDPEDKERESQLQNYLQSCLSPLKQYDLVLRGIKSYESEL